jgi:hypothetical protein
MDMCRSQNWRPEKTKTKPITNVDIKAHMKLHSNKSTCRGLALTEYLIILAIVAVAAIGVTSVFGRAVKTVISDCAVILSGGNTDGDNKEAIIQSAKEKGSIDSNFANFDRQ